MNDQWVRQVVAEVLAGYTRPATPPIPVEASARHVHLHQSHVEQLFGAGYRLQPQRELSQPGEFLARERVRLVGPRGTLEQVAVLGPARTATQVELSATDARALGVTPPLRLSGDLEGAADLLLTAGERVIHVQGCAIIAKNHIHMGPEDAAAFRVADRESVRVRMEGLRPLTFEDVTVRVRKGFALAMHIDFDEANACLWQAGCTACLAPPLEAAAASSARADRGERATATRPEPPAEADCGERVVTARVAEGLCALGRPRVYLPPRAVVTPSARDVLRQAKVEAILLREEGESP